MLVDYIFVPAAVYRTVAGFLLLQTSYIVKGPGMVASGRSSPVIKSSEGWRVSLLNLHDGLPVSVHPFASSLLQGAGSSKLFTHLRMHMFHTNAGTRCEHFGGPATVWAGPYNIIPFL